MLQLQLEKPFYEFSLEIQYPKNEEEYEKVIQILSEGELFSEFCKCINEYNFPLPKDLFGKKVKKTFVVLSFRKDKDRGKHCERISNYEIMKTAKKMRLDFPNLLEFLIISQAKTEIVKKICPFICIEKSICCNISREDQVDDSIEIPCISESYGNYHMDLINLQSKWRKTRYLFCKC
jgi:hypothetical protein